MLCMKRRTIHAAVSCLPPPLGAGALPSSPYLRGVPVLALGCNMDTISHSAPRRPDQEIEKCRKQTWHLATACLGSRAGGHLKTHTPQDYIKNGK